MNELNLLFTETTPEETVEVTAETVVEATEKDTTGTIAEDGNVLTTGTMSAETNETLAVEEDIVYCTCGVTTATTEPPKTQLGFEPKNFVDNLRFMGIGMLVIFLVIGLIILSTALINKLSSKKD